MARLPRVGGDRNQWGALWNALWSVAHEADGSLKQSLVDAAVAESLGSNDTPAQAAAAAIDDELASRNLLEAIDEDDLASDADDKVPTQQSVKAFVDGKIIDEDNLNSDSDTHVPTQQSVKAYVDANAGSTVIVSDTEPSSPEAGQLWFDTSA